MCVCIRVLLCAYVCVYLQEFLICSRHRCVCVCVCVCERASAPMCAHTCARAHVSLLRKRAVNTPER